MGDNIEDMYMVCALVRTELLEVIDDVDYCFNLTEVLNIYP